jgi:hypothetical protein
MSKVPSLVDGILQSAPAFFTITTTIIITTIFMPSFLCFPLPNVSAFHIDSRLMI